MTCRLTLMRAWTLTCFLSAFQFASSLEDTTLASSFLSRRCLGGRTAVSPFKDRTWTLEINPWTSHTLVTTIAGIVLREHLGYSVELAPERSTEAIYERVGMTSNSKPRANLEVWQNEKEDVYKDFVTKRRLVADVGHVGYSGRFGMYISRNFADSPDFTIPVEFYRTLDKNYSFSLPILRGLREHRNVTCGDAGTVTESGTVSSAAEEVLWCPRTDGQESLPTIVARRAPGNFDFSSLFVEGFAQTNGLQFAVSYLDRLFFDRASRSLTGAAGQLVFYWRPSSLLSHVQVESGSRPVRIAFPTDDCQSLQMQRPADLQPNRSMCDFPATNLLKIASSQLAADPMASEFFEGFAIPQWGNSESLTGAGMEDLLVSLVKDPAWNSSLTDDAFSTRRYKLIWNKACAWVLENEVKGVYWKQWSMHREVPFFADSMHSLYPYPTLLALLVISLVWACFLEHTWLWTTLSLCGYRTIRKKNSGWKHRTEVEDRLNATARERSNPPVEGAFSRQLSAPHSTRSTLSVHDASALPRPTSLLFDKHSPSVGSSIKSSYWQGLSDRIEGNPQMREFWKRVDDWQETHQVMSEPPKAAGPPNDDHVSFALHCFPCYQQDREVFVVLTRSALGAQSGCPMAVSVVIEENGGEAKNGRDFTAGEEVVSFKPGQTFAIMRLPIILHGNKWQNSYWFQVRLKGIQEGTAIVAAPAKANVLVFDKDHWPANIPQNKRGGYGISLVRYLWRSDCERRGEKWKKTMMAMLWLPVHGVFITTIVPKVLVDHVVVGVGKCARTGDNPLWFYWEGFFLVLLQVFSLGLHRWADVVQTRNRGRTGGCRQVHRAEMIKKFLFMDHEEHWVASDSNWFYSAIYDADQIVGNAYYQVYILFQSIVALSLSVVLVLGLTFWSYLKSSSEPQSQNATFNNLWYLVLILFIVPLSLFCLWKRRHLTWVTVIARKNAESEWFKSIAWVMQHWRRFYSFSASERAAIVKQIAGDNSKFVPLHWDARDGMNDTQWVAIWIYELAYCFILLFGVYALIQYEVYGMGVMEVGTYYALLTVYGHLGKYMVRLSDVFVNMCRAVVSLREIAAMLNQNDQLAARRLAERWRVMYHPQFYSGGTTDAIGNEDGVLGHHGLVDSVDELVFEKFVAFERPANAKSGIMFAEFKLHQQVVLPIGRLIGVFGHNEAVLQSFLGMIAHVIHPYGDTAEGYERVPTFRFPRHLRYAMMPLSTVTTTSAFSGSVLDQLKLLAPPVALCKALAESVGLDPDSNLSSLPTGDSQVFLIIKALVDDPDVLCCYKPMALVPFDVQKRVARLLRLWQMGGGLPGLARLLGVEMPEDTVYRSSMRTLIIGNPNQSFVKFRSFVRIDLEPLLSRGLDGDEDDEADLALARSEPLSPEPQTPPTFEMRRRPSSRKSYASERSDASMQGPSPMLPGTMIRGPAQADLDRGQLAELAGKSSQAWDEVAQTQTDKSKASAALAEAEDVTEEDSSRRRCRPNSAASPREGHETV